ncbi:MAG: NAD(P)-dependent oxidoreductase [Bacillota bacterium]
MKKVIVTGCGGFIGKKLSECLLKKGIYVVGIDVSDKNIKDIDDVNFKFVRANFSEYYKLVEIVNEKNFDVFYHIAWQGVYGEIFKDYVMQLDNAKYAGIAIEQAIELNCKKFVLAGSMNQYEAEDYQNKNDIQPRFTCVYASAKTAAEMICKTIAYNKGIEFNAGLISMVYGENNYSMMIPNIVMKSLLMKEEPKLIEGNDLYDLIYVQDVVNAFYHIGKSGLNLKRYYIGHRVEDLYTFKDWMLKIQNVINPAVKMSFGEYKISTYFDYNKIDTHSLYEDTNFTIENNFNDTIVKTSNWIKENLI